VTPFASLLAAITVAASGVQNILGKLCLRARTAASAFACEHHLV
jgi:DNA-binding NarL/FixJ family response regulator